ncbi:(Fe-S)-binding protein [Embleya hyalina]|uniref:Glycolate oxidase iron-sulfur subunit n=1 Tax=Embleya hyalina TaxID=516124 RepID=A0A401YJY1_9ACTN|nr:(Fe-S)-binding protein [Embleya hyalina]GCD94924.1 Fe-S oxidoreductase [Embleya hyalina]
MTGVFDPEELSRCISCGFCLPACPTYAATGDEASSPRGRINLMRALETGRLDADDPTLLEQSSACLGCRACEPVCPAGVPYGSLLEQWRDHQWRGRHRPPLARLLTIVASLPPVVRAMGWGRFVLPAGRGIDKATRPATPGTPKQPAQPTPPAGTGASLMLGCFERAMFPNVSRAARTLLPGLKVPDDQGCCGALHAHNGESTKGRALARRLGERLPGRIVTTSGGCAAHLADVIGRDRVAELSEVVDVSALPERRVAGRRVRVTLQDSCHLRNGLGVWREPREILSAVADFVETPGANECCGAAGTHSLLRPIESRRILDRKLDAIEAGGADVVVAVNPGCLRQLRTGLRRRKSRVRAVHLAEFLTKPDGGARTR